MKTIFAGVCLFLALIMVGPGFVADATKDHTNLVVKYEGTESCTRCHKNTAKDVATGLHYQMLGIPDYLEGWPKGQPAGMMNTY